MVSVRTIHATPFFLSFLRLCARDIIQPFYVAAGNRRLKDAGVALVASTLRQRDYAPVTGR